MWFSIFGLVVTVLLNVILVPRMGYMGCAVAAMTCYGLMMVASYVVGAYHYPIGYPLGKLLGYFGAAVVLYAIGMWLLPLAGISGILAAFMRLCLLAMFVLFFMRSVNIGFSTLVAPFKRFIRR